MASKGLRAEFLREIRERLAKRAAYRCSFPNCDRSTTGPGASDEQISTTGKAAHIYSARDGGPRGTGGLSYDQRRTLENGIWLCAEHAELIDKNNGAEFPAATLKAFKLMHEEKIRYERVAVHGKIGWLHSIVVDRGPVFCTAMEIQFGKVTILQGGNGSGKTALCDWLQGMSDPNAFARWTGRPESIALSAEVTYFDPFKQELKILAQSPNEIEYFLNGEAVPFVPQPIQFVRMKELPDGVFASQSPHLTDLEFLSQTLSISPALVRNMLRYVGVQRGGTVGRIVLDGDKLRIWTGVHGPLTRIDLQQGLSRTERCRVLLEIAAVFARYSAKRVPTVLLVDWAAKSFDGEWMRRVIDFLSSDENPFQTVLERVSNNLGGCESARVIDLPKNQSYVPFCF